MADHGEGDEPNIGLVGASSICAFADPCRFIGSMIAAVFAQALTQPLADFKNVEQIQVTKRAINSLEF
jgi:hypothetical protein